MNFSSRIAFKFFLENVWFSVSWSRCTVKETDSVFPEWEIRLSVNFFI